MIKTYKQALGLMIFALLLTAWLMLYGINPNADPKAIQIVKTIYTTDGAIAVAAATLCVVKMAQGHKKLPP